LPYSLTELDFNPIRQALPIASALTKIAR